MSNKNRNNFTIKMVTGYGSGGPVKRPFHLMKDNVILSEAKNPVSFLAKLTGFFVAFHLPSSP